MNIKPIPAAQAVNQTKESSEDRDPSGGQYSSSGKPKAKPGTQPQNQISGQEQTPEAGDAYLRSTQPADSQTVAELLASPPPTQTVRAKFPTPTQKGPSTAGAKKLNRSA